MILLGRRHPTHLSLSRFADGDLRPRLERRVARHVEKCEACRAYVYFIDELGAAARELRGPDVADDVIRRRRAGERGPQTGAEAEWEWERAARAARARARADRARPARAARTAADRRRSAEAVVVGLALVVVTASFLLFAPSAAATRGELSFGSTIVAPDAGVPITYSPAYYLAGEDSLRLRAEVTRNGGPAGNGGRRTELSTATLHRDGEGKFRGSLPLEDGDLFAVAVVEDFQAADLDTNSGRLWELYLEHEDGRPSIAALESHYRTLEAYNGMTAVEWVERLTEVHPDNPLGWALQYWHLSSGGGGSVSDSVREFQRNKLDELIRLAGPDPDPDGLLWLSSYARHLGEASVRDSLLDELARLDPEHPAAVDRLVVKAVAEFGFGSPALVARLEELWASSGRGTRLLVHSGVQAAAAAGQTEVLETWLARGLRHPEIEAADLLDDIKPFDGRAASWRASLLRMQLAEIEAPGDSGRPLRMSSSEYESQRRAAILSLRVELAGALIDSGDEAAAAALYREAADQAWRPDDLRPYVDFLIARGDTTAALPGIGLLVADPVSGDSAYREYATILEAGVDDPQPFIERSRAELRFRVLAALPVDRKLRNDTRVAPLEGEELTAAEYFADGPTVVLLWDARFGDRSRWLTTFKSLASREGAHASEVRTAIVVPPAAGVDLAALDSGGIPLIVDPAHELVAQLGARAVPSYVVVDRRLAVVAGLSDAASAFRIANVLSW